MPKPPKKPLMISPVPATAPAPAPRALSLKRLSRVRLSWFVVGSVFGVGISFFMNFVITALVIPEYQQLARQKGNAPIIEAAADAQPASKLAEKIEAASAVEPAPVTPITLSKVEDKLAAEAKTDQAAAESKEAAALTYPRTVALEIGHGKTLLDMLIANHVQLAEAQKVMTALKTAFNPQKLKAGQKISVTLARHETLGDKAAVSELAIKLPNFDTVELQRTDKGTFDVAKTREELTQHAYRGFGKVRTSLMQAAADGKIPTSTVNEIVHAFSYDIDFQRDIHPGDTIEVLTDRKTTADGRVGGYGEPRYAALTLHGKKHEIYRFKNSYGELAWFDASGNSVKKSLLRTPINAAHITSGFGMRMHPLLGYTKMHKGVDFGAATGTPILAAGDGVVEFKGWQNGYGNFVILRHNNTYETAYGHISKFGNINVGNRVRQGQIIAYVGMTGGATGPHLHYEVRQNDIQVNPVSKQFNMASGLTGKQLDAFNANKQDAMKELASMGGAPVKTAANDKPAKPAKAKAKHKGKRVA